MLAGCGRSSHEPVNWGGALDAGHKAQWASGGARQEQGPPGAGAEQMTKPGR